VWTTDSSGNWLSESAVLSGASAGLQALEPTFGQDFNGDGTIGAPPTAIETAGSTTLMPVGSTYYLYASGTTSGPQLKYGGVAVTIGQFGAWTPIGAEPSGSGYQVVWKNGTADQYKVWTVDNNGNRVSESAVLSGASFALQSLETTFGQDLNNDATIGRVTVAIESSAATTLSKSRIPTSCMPAARRRARS
jgi:serralysin